MGWYRLYVLTKFLILRKIYIFCLNPIYSILSRYFQHADAEINVPQVALTLREMQQISVVIPNTFRKAKVVRSQDGIVHTGSSISMR